MIFIKISLKFSLTACILFVLLIAVTGCQKDSDPSNPNGIIPNDFLSEMKYDKLIVEIQYVNGYAPTATTLDNLKSLLQQRLNKSGGITIVQNSISSPGKTLYSVDDISAIESVHRTQKPNGKTLTAYFFFADGDYSANSGNSKVLGIAYGSSSMALFEKTIKDFSGGITQPTLAVLESTVILHEFGHILGLVNTGTPMQSQHQDVSHGKHCNNQNCLMYYSVETSDIVANVVSGNIPSLDANCLADLNANGGK